MEYVDYYKTLGVPRDATQEEITRAYRKAARKYHPDVNKAAGAEDQFKQVNEAYQVIGDAEKRRRYDMLGADWKHGQEFRPPPGWSGFGPGVQVEFRSYPGGGGEWSEFFETFFGGGAGGGGDPHAGSGGFADVSLNDLLGGAFMGGRGACRRPRGRSKVKGADVESEIEISLEDAYRGATRTLQLQDASGRLRTLDVRIPPGVGDAQRVRLAGQGGAGIGGGPAGDLFLRVRVREDPRFRREGDDLVAVLDVAPWDAALGASVAVPTMDGPVETKVPPGRSSGDRLRLRGKGMPRRDGSRGDLYAEIRIVTPKRLTDRERRLFEELRDASSFRPSKD